MTSSPPYFQLTAAGPLGAVMDHVPKLVERERSPEVAPAPTPPRPTMDWAALDQRPVHKTATLTTVQV